MCFCNILHARFIHCDQISASTDNKYFGCQHYHTAHRNVCPPGCLFHRSDKWETELLTEDIVKSIICKMGEVLTGLTFRMQR